ncbi:hypothetical protein GQ55_6G273400 [Panicum hallii var. hallii]|uniref:Uncharacterized protein n=1 Tax=Panicum hallii var. hallii TaxID=1504633 RepID=A0A2T7DA53_9POAL|nr:hypothetical protein GQ55_6G273400 [Panicum hallii var. hallii]
MGLSQRPRRRGLRPEAALEDTSVMVEHGVLDEGVIGHRGVHCVVPELRDSYPTPAAGHHRRRGRKRGAWRRRRGWGARTQRRRKFGATSGSAGTARRTTAAITDSGLHLWHQPWLAGRSLPPPAYGTATTAMKPSKHDGGALCKINGTG